MRARGSSRIVYWAHEMVGEETTKLSLRTITVKKYIVRLTSDEQTQLSQMIRSGKAAARTLLHARILLKADTDSAAPAWWSDEAIIEALEVHSATVARVRQRFVEEGLDTALRPRPSKRQYARKLDGAA